MLSPEGSSAEQGRVRELVRELPEQFLKFRDFFTEPPE